MPAPTKDGVVLIVGGGTFGLSAAYHLTAAGYTNVVVLEKGDSIPGPLSAANDVNKIIRAEYEDPFYTELALQAMAEWARNPVLAPHYHQTGYLLANSAAAPEKSKRTLARSLESIAQHPAWRAKIMPVRTRADIRRVAPALDGDMAWTGYFNEFAGHAHATNALRSLHRAAVRNGARVCLGEAAEELLYSGDRCIGVRTSSARHYLADTVVLTLGARLGTVLPGTRTLVTAKAWSVAHVQLTPDEARRLKGIPVTYARDLGFFEEPESGTGLLKLCPSGAGYTNFAGGVSVPPDDNDFLPAQDEAMLRRLLQEALPGLARRPLVNKHICWCADTADSDFVIDAVPGRHGLFVATGDSGHAFKMLPIAGAWIKDLVEKGSQDTPRWRWKQDAGAGQGDVSWRTGQVVDLADVEKTRDDPTPVSARL